MGNDSWSPYYNHRTCVHACGDNDHTYEDNNINVYTCVLVDTVHACGDSDHACGDN